MPLSLSAGSERVRQTVTAYISYVENSRRKLQNVLVNSTAYYHSERNHQGLDNRIIDPSDDVGRSHGDVECREHLGGLLRYYYRAAA